MELLCALACGMVNRIPYGRSKELIMICPADTLMFGQKLEHIPETRSKLHGINNMIHNINLQWEEMIKIRNDHLAQELSTAKHQTKKEGRIARTIEPQIGDLVLVRNEEKLGYDKYGIIQAILSPQTLQIRTRSGIIERPSSITIPLSPQCLITGDGRQNWRQEWMTRMELSQEDHLGWVHDVVR